MSARAIPSITGSEGTFLYAIAVAVPNDGSDKTAAPGSILIRCEGDWRALPAFAFEILEHSQTHVLRLPCTEGNALCS